MKVGESKFQKKEFFMNTRSLFFVGILIWLGCLVVGSMAGNTVNTGMWSDVYFGSFILCALLAIWTVFLLISSGGVHVVGAKELELLKKKVEQDDLLRDVEKLGGREYLYYLVLCLLAIGMLILDYKANRGATGATSVWYMVWALADILVVIFAARQFYQLAAGKIVKVLRQG